MHAGEFQLHFAEAAAVTEQSIKGYINAAVLLPRPADPYPGSAMGRFCITSPDHSSEEAVPPQRQVITFAGNQRNMQLLA